MKKVTRRARTRCRAIVRLGAGIGVCALGVLPASAVATPAAPARAEEEPTAAPAPAEEETTAAPAPPEEEPAAPAPAEEEPTTAPAPTDEEPTTAPAPAEEEPTPAPAEEEPTAAPGRSEPEDRDDAEGRRPGPQPAKAKAEPSAPSPKRAGSPEPDADVPVAPSGASPRGHAGQDSPAPHEEPATTASADHEHTGGVSAERDALIGARPQRRVDAPPGASPEPPYGRAMGAAIEAALPPAQLGPQGAWRVAFSSPQAVGNDATVASQRDHTRSTPRQPAAPAPRGGHHAYSTDSASASATGSAGAVPLAFFCGVVMAAALHWCRLSRRAEGSLPLIVLAVPEQPG